MLAGSLANATWAEAASRPNVAPQASGQALTSIEGQRQKLLAQMLAQPANVELALQYAALSSQAGDLEGAISTLERLLIFAPGASRLNFELGVLYYRLGAYDAASAYFATASAAADATPDIKAQAAQYIAGATNQSAADRSFARVILGARYQTNANGGADGDFVNLNGIPFQLNAAAKADPDANGFIAANIHTAHDLESQGDRFDTDISLYGSLYQKHDELNTAAGEMHFGPVFNLERFSIAHSSLGLYGIFGGVLLKGDPYYYSAGAGALLTTALDPQTQGRLRLETRYEQYYDSALRPAVSSMSGERTRLQGDISHRVNDKLDLYGSIYGERKLALAAINGDWEGGAAVGAVFRFDGPGGGGAGPWSLDVSAGALLRTFDAPDPIVSTAARSDKAAFVQGALTVPVTREWSVTGTLGYSRQLSTYDLYTFDNLSSSLSVAKAF